MQDKTAIDGLNDVVHKFNPKKIDVEQVAKALCAMLEETGAGTVAVSYSPHYIEGSEKAYKITVKLCLLEEDDG